MRKLILVASVLALAGCEAEADVADANADAAAVEEVAEVDPAVGTYSWTEDDGTEVTGHLEADGTAYMTVDGERTNPASWARSEDGQICMEGVDEEGEEWSDCMTFGEVAADGTVEITDSEGNVDTVVKVS